ncbi:hypothetical protein EYB53_020360 [Candidatus Chloroploca sp. M-50]|uniref:Uncharacterized protein n=1 Tax=Candidatus Chloroploca mongolica TaxID=2528176 RepID=A0ABS4DF60_9CHLR|nr:hypothetical protein [Candidatus Chloroploca mongolica]MBP1468078.1 hypothetical protein [Candidatus Chloroploca mongolica]
MIDHGPSKGTAAVGARRRWGTAAVGARRRWGHGGGGGTAAVGARRRRARTGI